MSAIQREEIVSELHTNKDAVNARKAFVSFTYLSARRFRQVPQVGRLLDRTWATFRDWLSHPQFANRKDAHGAWCSCAIEGGVIKGGVGSHYVVAADIDRCVEGDLDRTARVLARRCGLVIPTFSASTGAKPEAHRVVQLLSRPISAEEFPLVRSALDAELARSGIVVDKSCRNANRLFFATVAKSPGSWLGVRQLDGEPVDVDALLIPARAAAKREAAERARRPRAARRLYQDPRYLSGAFDSARRNIASAVEGDRHDTLLREAWSLAAKPLSEEQIREALLDQFVEVAGDERRDEGERAIRDGVRARHRRDAS